MPARSLACPTCRPSSPRRESRSPTPLSQRRSAVPRAPRSCVGNTPTLTGSSATAATTAASRPFTASATRTRPWRPGSKTPATVPPSLANISIVIPKKPQRAMCRLVGMSGPPSPRAMRMRAVRTTAVTPSTRTALPSFMGGSHLNTRPTCSPPRRPISSIARPPLATPSSYISRHMHPTARRHQRRVTPRRSRMCRRRASRRLARLTSTTNRPGCKRYPD